MGLIHSRASKKRDKAEAKLLDAQRKATEAATDEDKPWYQQRTVGSAIKAATAKKDNS